MRYMFIMLILYLCGTVSLYAEVNSLGDILQEAGEKKPLVKPLPQKKTVKKRSRFVFKDSYEAKEIESKEKAREKKKSQSYEYANKSRFKFKINDGSPQSNMIGGSGGMSGGDMGGAGKGRGGRR